MKRINIIGTSGSGKSTFSKRLAEVLDYPHYEMDALFWKPDWRESTDEEFFAALRKATAGSHWILDGNYNRTIAVKWANADTVIWIDYSFSRTVVQAIKRALVRSITRKEIWQGTGNKESFQKNFLSKDSVLLWTIKTYKRNKERYEELMRDSEFQHINFVRLTTPSEARRFIESLS